MGEDGIRGKNSLGILQMAQVKNISYVDVMMYQKSNVTLDLYRTKCLIVSYLSIEHSIMLFILTKTIQHCNDMYLFLVINQQCPTMLDPIDALRVDCRQHSQIR